ADQSAARSPSGNGCRSSLWGYVVVVGSALAWGSRSSLDRRCTGHENRSSCPRPAKLPATWRHGLGWRLEPRLVEHWHAGLLRKRRGARSHPVTPADLRSSVADRSAASCDSEPSDDRPRCCADWVASLGLSSCGSTGWRAPV